MATAVEQLVIDSQSRFLEMKSLQPYSTKDEYLYAMKEDLADWLANMYPDWRPITAENFLSCLENGVLLCHHANNVNEAARKVSSENSSLTNCKYRTDARPQTFNARDNVSQFIKWSRNVAGVREVLMFESDDLILRKNEKNFILCLLEIARYGAKFGVSVPAIIKLEHEIEQEIEREKYPEKFSPIPFEDIPHESNDQNEFNHSNGYHNHAFEQSFVNVHYQTFEQPQISMVDRCEENDDAIVPDEVTTTIDTFKQDDDEEQASLNRTIGETTKQTPMVAPASSSHLHKTVVNIINSCCCSQRFPVIRIGEGKYRIGENGTIIFIRILRNHVMVRVGGGWDTLENYLNKHDPCRRSGHHRHEHSHQHNANIPILAIPNTNVSSSVQKNTPFGKSVTLKTEEFPLPKPSNHDTNLNNAQLVITRGTDGRHRIGQITYKAEEDTHSQQPACPHHHHHHQSSPTPPMKRKAVRNSGRVTPSSIFNKQSSPSTDQDYSSFTETTTTSPSKPSPSSSVEFKEDEESIEQTMASLSLTTAKNRHSSPIISIAKPSPPRPPAPIKSNNLSITESVIGNIDGYISPISTHVEQDFDIHDIEEVMGIEKKPNANDTTLDMDNDSLDSAEGVLEEPKKPTSTKKPSGYVSAFYLAQKQKFHDELAANRKRSITSFNRFSSRSSTSSNIADNTARKEDSTNKQRRKPMSVTSRSQSSDMIDKQIDISKLDRDSGFDEQDFRRERLNSNGDDNSSISSIRSARSSTARSMNFEIRENKSFELRMKKLDAKRNSPLPTRRISTSTSRRASDCIPPTPPSMKHRKNSQPISPPKVQGQLESVDL